MNQINQKDSIAEMKLCCPLNWRAEVEAQNLQKEKEKTERREKFRCSSKENKEK